VTHPSHQAPSGRPVRKKRVGPGEMCSLSDHPGTVTHQRAELLRGRRAGPIHDDQCSRKANPGRGDLAGGTANGLPLESSGRSPYPGCEELLMVKNTKACPAPLQSYLPGPISVATAHSVPGGVTPPVP